MSIARSILPLGPAGTSPAASAATLIKTVAEASRQRAAHPGPEVSVTVSATVRASSRDEDARIVNIFHRIYQNSPLNGRSFNVTADDARVLVAGWAQNAGYTSSDLTSDDFVAFVKSQTAGEVRSANATPSVAPHGPEVAVTLSAEAQSPTIDTASDKDADYWNTPAGQQGLRDAAWFDKLQSQNKDALEAQMKANGTWEGSAMAQMEQSFAAYGKIERLLRQAIGIPDGKSFVRGGAASGLDDLVAAQNGLPLPALFQTAASDNDSTGFISLMSMSPEDRHKGLFVAFDRATAATVKETAFTLRPTDGQSTLNVGLDDIQRRQETDAPRDQFKRFDLVDSTGQTVGMVLSKGWDDMAQASAGTMLAGVFGILRSSADHTV